MYLLAAMLHFHATLRLDGQWYVSAGDPTEEFSKQYRARYGVDPSWGGP